MTHRNRNPRIVLALLSVAWSLYCCAHVRADIEIESFTRYRVDNFDNNNNGYVDDVDDADIANEIENTTVAAELAKDMNFEFSTNPAPSVPFNPGNPSSGLSNSGSGFTDTIGDGYADDIDRDFFYGDDGTINTQNAALNQSLASDFDDLVTLPTSFQSMKGNSYLQSRSVQLERVVRFSPKLSDEQKARREEPSGYWEIYYGARFFQFDDRFRMNGSGGVLGETTVGSQLDNQTAGPHVGIYGSLERSGWRLGAGGFFQAGLYLSDAAVSASIGQDLVPGQYNRPLYLAPTGSVHQDSDDTETFFGELRAQASRPLTDWLTLNLGCSGYYFGDLRYADESIKWELPAMGLVDNGTEEQIVTTAYTSLEFRR